MEWLYRICGASLDPSGPAPESFLDFRRQAAPGRDQLPECHAVPTQIRQPLGLFVAKSALQTACVRRDAGAIPAVLTFYEHASKRRLSPSDYRDRKLHRAATGLISDSTRQRAVVRIRGMLPKALLRRYSMTRTWLLSWPVGRIYPNRFEPRFWRLQRDRDT